MKYVLDSSVAFKWVVPETNSDKALLLRDDCRNKIHELIAPDFCTIELAHSLTRAERQGRIMVGEALDFWTDVMTTAPDLLAHLPLMARAIDNSSADTVGCYDALYVAVIADYHAVVDGRGERQIGRAHV